MTAQDIQDTVGKVIADAKKYKLLSPVESNGSAAKIFVYGDDIFPHAGAWFVVTSTSIYLKSCAGETIKILAFAPFAYSRKRGVDSDEDCDLWDVWVAYRNAVIDVINGVDVPDVVEVVASV